MSNPTIDTEVRNLIAEQLQVPLDDVTDGADIVSDLDADSLEVVELVVGIETQFNIDIEDREAEGLRTVGDVIRLVEAKVGV